MFDRSIVFECGQIFYSLTTWKEDERRYIYKCLPGWPTCTKNIRRSAWTTFMQSWSIKCKRLQNETEGNHQCWANAPQRSPANPMAYTPYNNLHLMFLHTVWPHPHVHPLHPPKKAGARTLLHLTVCGTNHSRDFGSMLCFGFLKSAPWPKTGSEPSLSKLNHPWFAAIYTGVLS